MQDHNKPPCKTTLPRGVHLDRIARDFDLAATLRADDMERFAAVPKTVMINAWQAELEWLIVDRTYPSQVARRLQLLCEQPGLVIDRMPGAEVRAAEMELRDAVADYLFQAYPQYFRREGDVFLSPLMGLAIDLGEHGADPMVAVALMATEDMLLLMPERRGPHGELSYVLKSGALLFPNDWSLKSHFNLPRPAEAPALATWEAARAKSEKAARLGKSPHEIHHGHVAHYTEHFSSRVDLFFANMEAGLRTWRRNWGMRMSDELFLHSDRPPPDLPSLSADNWERHGFLRSEHETFTKLPQSGAVVFTIKTYMWKLAELVKNPTALEALQTANRNLAPGMFDYRAAELPSFREFLARQA